MKTVFLQVEYGFSSETYNFDELIVATDDKGNILKKTFGLTMLVKLHIVKPDMFLEYPSGYTGRDQLYRDLSSKKISIWPKQDEVPAQ